ncbi:DNA repair protein RadC [Devosia ginsengisoli]|uniref:RadC family protein n=1 Tax=Devosia ginsengisoli TaxID=400770 RepID=UPI0026EC8571|nr:DNA repair protein RadC [Devosia ginsengisoli]MCR6671478.1 DNA repair protein RadC [Devosia ginsengisoli]
MKTRGMDEAPTGRLVPQRKQGWDQGEQERLLTKLLRTPLGVARSRGVAAALMDRYGSLPAVLAAPSDRLLETAGVGSRVAAHLALTLEVARRLARERIDPSMPVLDCWGDLLDYCHLMMAHEKIEQFRILFLDKKSRLIADEVQQTGTVDHTPVYPREVIKRALEHSATALILVHNHPSGDPLPSSSDVRMTKEISDIAKPLGITLHDHIIIGRSGQVSLRALKLL